jgi:putative FmdB family regulatory protein
MEREMAMPTYLYECPHCGHTQEAQRAMDERDNAPQCEQCGEEMARKFVDAPFTVRVTHISEL